MEEAKSQLAVLAELHAGAPFGVCMHAKWTNSETPDVITEGLGLYLGPG